MATRTTAKTTAKTNTNECVIKCNPHRELACGYTKVKIMTMLSLMLTAIKSIFQMYRG